MPLFSCQTFIDRPIVVLAGNSLYTVDGTAAGLERKLLKTMDETRKLAQLTFRDVEGKLLGSEGGAAAPFAAADAIVPIANPLSETFAVLRPSALPGLIEAVAHNRRREQRDVRLFEVGACFDRTHGERRRLACAWTGAAVVEHWSGPTRDVDFFDITAVAERVADALGLPVHVVGADVKQQSRDHNAAVAERLGIGDSMEFVVGSIQDVVLDPAPEVVLALHACDTATDDALARALRVAAEMENLKRRAETQQNDARAFAIQRFAKDLLGVADNLERALMAAPKDTDGPTVALVTGVPLGTFIGQHFGWRETFLAVSALGVLAFVGSLLFVPRDVHHSAPATLRQQLAVLGQPRLLLVYAMTAVGYGGSFVAFTFLAPILQQVSGYSASAVSAVMLVYGVSVAVGNLWGGRLADRRGPVAALVLIFALLALVLLVLQFTAPRPVAVLLTVLAWGAVAFGNVPGLQVYVVQQAQRFAPQAVDVASGLNIAAFNLGIAGGAWLGGHIVAGWGLMHTPWIGAGVVLAAVGLTAWSGRLDRCTTGSVRPCAATVAPR